MAFVSFLIKAGDISTTLFMVKKLQTVLFFAVLRVTRTKTYGSYNNIKDLAFFKISSQR